MMTYEQSEFRAEFERDRQERLRNDALSPAVAHWRMVAIRLSFDDIISQIRAL